MSRLVVAAVLVSLLASGCGSGGGAESDGGSSGATPSASASPTAYFEAADTAAINKAAAAAQKAGAKAQAPPSTDKCNKAGSKGYEKWRRCWHKLLDPFQLSLNNLAAEMNTLTSHDLPAACVSSLSSAADAFAGFAKQVERLLAGIDSEKRAAQVKALRVYDRTLSRIAAGYTKPFQSMTQVCYSPRDLESINASPSPAP